MDDFAANLRKSPYVASVKENLRTSSDPSAWDFEYELQVDLKEGIAP